MRVAKVYSPSNLWRLTSLLALLVLAPQVGLSAATDELFPAQAPASTAAAQSLIGTLASATRSLDPQLKPAAQFEAVFAKIAGGLPQSEWREELEKLSLIDAADPVAKGVRQLAKIWLARAQIADIDVLLRKFYRNNVFFPPSLDVLGKDLPDKLRVDPWGEPWSYNQRAPAHLQKLGDQRYYLAPKQYPTLTTLKQATRNRAAASRAWKVSARELGGTRALEFRSQAGLSVAQAGGDVDNCKLLFVAQNWALMSNQDQLFTVAF